MKCPTCKTAGQKSTVYPMPIARTCMGWTPYYDEDGKYHSHDLNDRGQSFKCSNGHTFHLPPKPCWCGWSNAK